MIYQTCFCCYHSKAILYIQETLVSVLFKVAEKFGVQNE